MVKNILNCKLTSLFCLYSHNPKVHLMVGQFFSKKKKKKKKKRKATLFIAVF